MGSKYNEDKLIMASNFIEDSTLEVIKDRKYLTADIGGKASTVDMTNAIIEKVKTR
jgi:isocitrate/isopropylmalate dehydrogenase